MDLEKKAIERIRMASELSLYHYKQPLICTYSGGKDSDVMLELFKRSGVPFEVLNSHTTVDAPPTVYHIRKRFRQLEEQGIKATIKYPPLTMWQLIPKKLLPPTRVARYCCAVFKEGNTPNRFVATGVRWAESKKRQGRQEIEPSNYKLAKKMRTLDENAQERLIVERCEMRASMIVNPILDWEDRDIWEFYNTECGERNPLYDMGYYRVGCIGCPMAVKSREKEFADFPTYRRAYIRAFDKMLDAIHAKGKTTIWKTGEDVFRWWMESKNIDGQYSMILDGEEIIGYAEKRG